MVEVLVLVEDESNGKLSLDGAAGGGTGAPDGTVLLLTIRP